MIAKLVSVAEMVAIERAADAAGHTYAQMMEFAGRGVAEQIEEAYGFLRAEGALGLVGSGNNGGDTLVALAWLAEWGWKTAACLVRPRPAEDPLVARFLAAGGEVCALEDDLSGKHVYDRLAGCGVLIDGILGTGIRLPLKADLALALEHIRQALDGLEDPPAVVAVDCPSGVDCDTGEAAPQTLPADLTVTMAAFKQGLLKFPAYEYVGELRLVGIGLPQDGETLDAYRSVQVTVPDADDIRRLLPDRPLQAHKGTFGTALIVAGSQNYTGAVLLAGEAAYRIGTGLVTLAVTEMIQPMLAGHIPEATWLVLPEAGGGVSPAAARVILDNLERVSGLLLGPGFGLASPTAEFMTRFLAGGQYPLQPPAFPPMVVDADGLKLLARQENWAAALPPDTVLTPHPGELSVLTGLSRDEIQANRLEIARRYSKQWGHVVVLKGAFTVVAAPDGRTAIIPVASPALARAGSGDVLAGMIVGLLAQCVDPYDAAVAGAWIHAQAGVRAATALGNSACVMAGDLIEGMIDTLASLA